MPQSMDAAAITEMKRTFYFWNVRFCMNKTTPIVPAGANELVVAISSLCEEKNAYKHCGIKPPHYVVSLDAGNGQTTVVRYIADVMLNNDIRSFRGMDQYLEYRLDGSMDQLKQVFGDIGSCAVYTNSRRLINLGLF